MGFSIEPNRDAALAERLERTEFRRGPREVAHRFALDPDGFFVARDGNGEPVGCMTCIVHADAELAWIGGMVVLPRHRGQGIARALLRAGLAHAAARGTRRVGLDASDMGRPLYEREGFARVGWTSRWTRLAPATPIGERIPYAVYPASKAELREIADFDRPRFGANRAPWLAHLLEDHPHRAFVAYERAGGALAGFAIAQDGHIGPLVADAPRAAAALLAACEAAGAPPVAHLLDVSGDAARVFAQAGFAPDGTRMLRMMRGAPPGGRDAAVYALGTWALG